MLLDIFSVLNSELLANVSCNSFAKALMSAHYIDDIITVNNRNLVSYNNIISLIEFKYDKDVMCIGYPVTCNKDKDRYMIDLDNLVVANVKYDIAAIVANHDYFCRTNNKTTAEANLLYSTIKSVLSSKVVREA